MRGTRVEIRLAALRNNALRAAELAGDAQVFAMVKANGYGHGLLLAAETMLDSV